MDNTRLVAPSITCEGVRGIGPQHLDGNHSVVAHISWQAFAFDQVRRPEEILGMFMRRSIACCRGFHLSAVRLMGRDLHQSRSGSGHCRQAGSAAPTELVYEVQVALKVMRGVDNIFKCHDPSVVEPNTFQAALASIAVLQAGYNMDTLMLRYQGAHCLSYVPELHAILIRPKISAQAQLPAAHSNTMQLPCVHVPSCSSCP